jgi:NAD(P)H-flavin reductase
MDHKARITSVVDEARDVLTLTLEPILGFTFQPGQFAFIGPEGKPRLPMAIASGVNDEQLQFSIRRSLHTRALLSLHPGDWLLVQGPLGTSFPIDAVDVDHPLYLIAGGTGMTPVRSVVRSLGERQAFAKVYYGVRTSDDLMYRDELSHWECDVYLAIEHGQTDGHTLGLVTAALSIETLDANGMAFVCGPPAMLKAVLRLLQDKGLAHERIYVSVTQVDAVGKVVGPVLLASQWDAKKA